jgi:hypothetical protein
MLHFTALGFSGISAQGDWHIDTIRRSWRETWYEISEEARPTLAGTIDHHMGEEVTS